MRSVFLYPTARTYPFDEVCEQIVRGLESRGFAVPGVRVEFRDYALGRYVTHVHGPNFRLWFCRQQRTVGEWYDVAAVSDITIPQEHMSVYADGSGPTYEVSVGTEYDDVRWIDRTLRPILPLVYRKPRTHLRYSGRADLDGRYFQSHPPYAVADSDLGRMWLPEPVDADHPRCVAWEHARGLSADCNDLTMDAPRVVSTAAIYEHFAAWLREHALPLVTEVAHA